MPSFTIYKGEMGLQRENQILNRENAALKRAYKQLADFAAQQGITGVPAIEDIQATAQQAVPGEAFRSQVDGANCEVVIGAPGAGSPNRPTPLAQPTVGQPMRPEIAAQLQRRQAQNQPQRRQQAAPMQMQPAFVPPGMPSEAELMAAGIPLGPPGYAPQPGGGMSPNQVGATDDFAERVNLLELGPSGSR